MNITLRGGNDDAGLLVVPVQTTGCAGCLAMKQTLRRAGST
jgi:hypothetical protein